MIAAFFTGLVIGWLVAEIFQASPDAQRRADLREGRRLFALELLPLLRARDHQRLAARVRAEAHGETAPSSPSTPQPSPGGNPDA